MIIAIDGHSSCGKSTIAKDLAKQLNFTYVDTGAMYRAVTLFCQRNNLINQSGTIDTEQLKAKLSDIQMEFRKNAEGKQEMYLNEENVEAEIRGLAVANQVSLVSKIDFVRKYCVEIQRNYAQSGNIIMDGRDIGTVVFPNADYKFFVTASAEIRAQRRYEELQQKGQSANFAEVLENIKSRDFADTTRTESPLKQASDAILCDTSNHTRQSQLEWILNKINI